MQSVGLHSSGALGGFPNAALRTTQLVLIDVLIKLKPNAEKFPATAQIASIDRELLIDRKKAVNTGTAFYINKSGQMITAAHVLRDCLVLEAQKDGVTVPRQAQCQQQPARPGRGGQRQAHRPRAAAAHRPDDHARRRRHQRRLSAAGPARRLPEPHPRQCQRARRHEGLGGPVPVLRADPAGFERRSGGVRRWRAARRHRELAERGGAHQGRACCRRT